MNITTRRRLPVATTCRCTVGVAGEGFLFIRLDTGQRIPEVCRLAVSLSLPEGLATLVWYRFQSASVDGDWGAFIPVEGQQDAHADVWRRWQESQEGRLRLYLFGVDGLEGPMTPEPVEYRQ